MIESEARAWMMQHVEEYEDKATGEVNCTAMAEACAGAFDMDDQPGPLDDPDHWIWDLAVRVAEKYEQR